MMLSGYLLWWLGKQANAPVWYFVACGFLMVFGFLNIVCSIVSGVKNGIKKSLKKVKQ